MTTMKQLHREYSNALDVQRLAISANLKRLKAAQRKNDFAEIKRLNSVLNILYDEKRELEENTRAISRYIVQ